MSNIRPSHRPTREGPLLVLAIALVCTVCFPLYQWASSEESEQEPRSGPKSTEERLQQLLMGPEKIGCYAAFTWGIFILGSRYLEVLRQRKAFDLDLLPTEQGARILPDDA